MLNQQKPEGSYFNKDGYLQVHSIWSTMQGEGPFAGVPACFIRLSHCNLQCPLCDTDYTSIVREMSAEQVMAEAVTKINTSDRRALFVITGGEPFRQNLVPLIDLLLRFGTVQIETNGTLGPGPEWRDFVAAVPARFDGLVVVCSPKTPKVHPYWLCEWDTHWKYIVEYGKTDITDGLPTCSLGSGHVVQRPPNHAKHRVYVQPLDSKDPTHNDNNMREAVAICMQHNYRLCLQLHKIIGLD